MLLVYFTGKKIRKRWFLHNLHSMRRKESKCQSKLLINVEICFVYCSFFSQKKGKENNIKNSLFTFPFPGSLICMDLSVRN